MSDYLPSEIREKNEQLRRKALELDIRRRIQAELNFMSLRQADRDQLRRQYLEKLEFNLEIPMRQNPWFARLAYHRSDLELIRDHDFMAFYLRGINE